MEADHLSPHQKEKYIYDLSQGIDVSLGREERESSKR